MRAIRVMAAMAIGLGALLCIDGVLAPLGNGWTGTAEARIGRPATPVSYAGVARRTTRRAVGATAAIGATAAAAAPRCVTTYNSYGQAVTTCY